MNSEANDTFELNEEKSNNKEKEDKVVGESLRSLLFRERMKGLLPQRRHLKNWMRDKMVSYVGLFWLGPPPSRTADETSRRLATRKYIW